jgi:hypothetical protein
MVFQWVNTAYTAMACFEGAAFLREYGAIHTNYLSTKILTYVITAGKGGGQMWDSDLPSEVTSIGQDIGLIYSGKCIRPVACRDLSITYVVVRQDGFDVVVADPMGRIPSGDFALCWKKNFNNRYTHSGFMQYPLGHFLWRDDTTASYFKFAVSGWPLLFD